jgi:hypothetical protein
VLRVNLRIKYLIFHVGNLNFLTAFALSLSMYIYIYISAGQEGIGRGCNSKRVANVNTTYVIFFTKYEKYVVKTISFDNVIDKFVSIKARKLPL